MESSFIDNVLKISLEGTIDTTNSNQVTEDIEKEMAKYSDFKLVIDLEKVRYVSSAGLRMFLKLKKANKDLSVINVTNEVYDVFDMTGFTEMIDIKKAYRKIDVSNCELVGEGSNGIVYRLNEDTVVKVYKNSDSLSEIEREKKLAQAALVMGINTAISYDIVQVDNLFGSVFELLNSKSITKWIKEDKENIDKYIQVYVNMLKEMHSTEVVNPLLPDEKEICCKWLDVVKGNIDDQHFDKLSHLFNDCKDTNTFIHGDFHTSNVHYNLQEPILLDMDTIAYGNPIFEFGNIFNAYVGFGIIDPTNIERFLKLDIDTCHYVFKKTLEMYFNTTDTQDIENKAKVVGYTRILNRTIKRDPNNVSLIEAVKKELFNAIDAVETLDIN